MARYFTRSSSQYLAASSSPVSELPLTLAIWFRRNAGVGVGEVNYIASISKSGDSGENIELRLDADEKLMLLAVDGGATVSCTNSSTTTSGQWYHAAAVIASSTSKTLYQNGGNVASVATSSAPAGLDLVAIGCSYRSASPANYWEGGLACAAIWNAALTSVEVASLYNNGIGLDPRSVRPDALVAFWPLITGDAAQDYVGAYDFASTASDPTNTQHPPVLMRSRPRVTSYTSVVTPSIATIEIAGTRQVGNTLTCNATSSPSGATFTYQWYMADDIAGTNQTAISGATSQTYDLSYANIGAATKLYEGLDANAEAFIACGATPTLESVEGDETVSSYVSITEAAVSAPAGSPFESAFIR